MGTKGDLKRKSTSDGTTRKKKVKRVKKNTVNANVTKEKKIKIVKENPEEAIITEVLDKGENVEFSLLKDKVSENTLKAAKNMGFTHLENLQARCVLPLLEGKNLVGVVKNKSKSNLAFLIPVIESINKFNAKSKSGTGCIIVSSTRESALQIFGILKELLQFEEKSCCLLTDGSDQKTEARKLCKGAKIIVATPKRLLYHLENTPDFLYKNLQLLIVDETERILETGFENNLKQIIDILPKNRQTALFMREKINVDGLVILTMKNDAVFVEDLNAEHTEEKMTQDLEEGYVLAQWDRRFHFLLSFLEKNKKKKIIVIFSSCLSTKHHHDLFISLDVPVSSIHGKQKLAERTQVFSKFCTSPSGILLCAEATASEVIFPSVDWILQFDPPENPKEHINRLSETNKESKGKSVLVLSPEEIGFLAYLKEAGVSTNEIPISWSKIKNVQLSLEKLMSQNYFLHLSGKEAFKAFVKSYDSHHLKEIFNINALDLTKIAKSFGFTVPPAVDLSITEKDFDKSARPEKRLGGGGYGFFKTINTGDKKKRSMVFKQVGKRKNVRKTSS